MGEHAAHAARHAPGLLAVPGRRVRALGAHRFVTFFAITDAVVGAIFAEYAGATSGLGIYIQNAKNSFRTDLVLAAVGVSAALTLALFALTFLVERLVTPWSRAERRT